MLLFSFHPYVNVIASNSGYKSQYYSPYDKTEQLQGSK